MLTYYLKNLWRQHHWRISQSVISIPVQLWCSGPIWELQIVDTSSFWGKESSFSTHVFWIIMLCESLRFSCGQRKWTSFSWKLNSSFSSSSCQFNIFMKLWLCSIVTVFLHVIFQISFMTKDYISKCFVVLQVWKRLLVRIIWNYHSFGKKKKRPNMGSYVWFNLILGMWLAVYFRKGSLLLLQ